MVLPLGISMPRCDWQLIFVSVGGEKTPSLKHRSSAPVVSHANG
jgi:hypothetical protein